METLTVTLSLQTSGSGPVALATDINGITLAGNADYSSDTQSFLSGAVAGDTVTLTRSEERRGGEEGRESLTALLVNKTRNADVAEDGNGTVKVTDNDSLMLTADDRMRVE